MPLSQEQTDQLVEDVAAIKRAVIGEEKTGQKGLVKRMEIIEIWKDSITIRIATISGGLFVVGIIARYIITGKI